MGRESSESMFGEGQRGRKGKQEHEHKRAMDGEREREREREREWESVVGPRSCLRMSFAGVCLLPKCARPEWQVSSTSCMTMSGGQWHLAGKCVIELAGPYIVLTLMIEHVGTDTDN